MSMSTHSSFLLSGIVVCYYNDCYNDNDRLNDNSYHHGRNNRHYNNYHNKYYNNYYNSHYNNYQNGYYNNYYNNYHNGYYNNYHDGHYNTYHDGYSITTPQPIPAILRNATQRNAMHRSHDSSTYAAVITNI